MQKLGLPADALIARAKSDDHKARMRVQTEQARARGVFGAPTFFSQGELFWGDDRLEQALAWATR